MPDSHVKLGEKVILDHVVLAPNDPIFDPKERPPIDVAIGMILGYQNGYEIPFAAVPFGHHAGIPEQNLFRCLFGRDSLVISSLLRQRVPGLEINVIKALGTVQGIKFDELSEEEPGRIPHEIREIGDKRAKELEIDGNWRFPYFGTVDATLLWINSVANLALNNSLDLDEALNGTSLWERVARATSWVCTRLETPSGFIESSRSNPHGIRNQVWKDSEDSYMHHDGTLATGESTASIETVGETFDALNNAALIQEMRPSPLWPMSSSELRRVAKGLQSKLIDLFWLEDRFALGVERNKAGVQIPLDSQASNQGRLLDSKILDGPNYLSFRKAIAEALTDSQLLGWAGLRTLSANHPSYRPCGYHTGSAWPMDGVLASRGLSRHGFNKEALLLLSNTKRAIESIGGYPEFFRGDANENKLITSRLTDVVNGNGVHNRICQPPQMIQGWSVGAYAWITDNLEKISKL